MSYRMIHAARRLMCDKFSILCTLADLNAKQTKEDEEMRKGEVNEFSHNPSNKGKIHNSG